MIKSKNTEIIIVHHEKKILPEYLSHQSDNSASEIILPQLLY